jgi:hypothetical protein
MTNPFKPSFGVSPPLLAGRDSLIEEFADGLDDGPGSPSRATLYTGARGSGKTVMLNAVEDQARRRGWIVVSETAAPGLVERLTRRRLPEVLRSFDPDAVQRRLTRLTAPFTGGGGLAWETLDAHVAEADLRSQIGLLTELLAENGTGLLITVDEIHRQQIAELRELATTVQHTFREERELAFAGAGLTAAVSDVLNDEVLTFLRRADRHHLGRVPFDEVRRALREPIVAAGREPSDEALEVMAEGTRGYPFLIQLVGAQSWRVRRDAREISREDGEEGVAQARRRLGSLVYEPALDEASDVDKSFLLAMSRDDGASRIADVVERLGITRSYASVYRRRLIDAELIESAGRGRVDFALPYLREYLREHAAADALL